MYALRKKNIFIGNGIVILNKTYKYNLKKKKIRFTGKACPTV